MQNGVRRLVIAGVPHHVVIRGNNRRRLFSYNHECVLYVRLLEKAVQAHGCTVQALALMSNHVHLLMTPSTSKSLSRCVKQFCQTYAYIRNRRRGGSGKLFEERFASFAIESNEHLAIVTAYIDLNAAQAGLEIDSLWQQWSTYGYHVGDPQRCKVPKSIWVPSLWYRDLAPTDDERAKTYRQFAQKYLERKLEVLHIQRLESHFLRTHRLPTLSKRFERPDRTRAV